LKQHFSIRLLNEIKMVNYDSIKVGLEVEFMIDNHIFDGVVRYKGGINGYDGLWIGVEANQPSTIEPIIALIFFEIFSLFV